MSKQPVFNPIVCISNAKNYRFVNIAKLRLSLNTHILPFWFHLVIFIFTMIIVNVLLEVYLQKQPLVAFYKYLNQNNAVYMYKQL